ncbi:MAG: tRNA epoxyqueuosine(34) reductase QueG [Bacteroidetes bacterium]|nr:tRNA epoxyqueuosine(34) reductase QueG [Bacteroidota bacterium]
MLISNEDVIKIAKSLEFDLIGFAVAEPLDEEVRRLKTWLSKGYNHAMDYMERNIEKREDVTKILDGAKSVISLGLNYYKNGEYSGDPAFGKVSRYAWGTDYHFVIWKKLEEFSEELKKLNPEVQIASYVDTGPVMDKVWAVRAGNGWLGKHTNVISREIGSWFFIATIITDMEFEPAIPQTDLCGSCTACLDACPTGALVEEYVLDASKCISNLTIENRGEIPAEFKGKFDGWIFGCDICQDVCPWNNKFGRETASAEFQDSTNIELNLEDVTQMTNSEFRKEYISSPINRARLKGMKRNAEFLRNSNKV